MKCDLRRTGGCAIRPGGESTRWRVSPTPLLLSLLFAFGACAGRRIHVEVESAPAAAFSRYATYCWWQGPLPVREPPTPPAILDWRVRNAVDAELAGKGYQRTQGQPCDFIVSYTAKTSHRQVDTFGEFADYRSHGGEGGLQDVLGGYSEGALALHLLDASTKELLWRASASAVADPSKQQERVTEAVQQMLKDLPPRLPSRGTTAP